MTLIVASYARYSSDNQRRESIDDQERKTDKLVLDKLGLTVSLRFRDLAESGWDMKRSDYQRLMKAGQRKEFQVLALDDLSRLGRDQDERGLTIRRLEFWGVRILSADGYDSTMPRQQRAITRSARGMIDSIYSIDLAEKTHRGQAGQALKGFNTGGRSYGYRHVPIEDPTRTDIYGRPLVVAVKREVDEEKAVVVRLIFEMFADGKSPRAIARELNRQHLPSPRGSTWAFSAIYGDRRRGVGILNNPLYVGDVIWNRSKWERDPDSGKRKRTEERGQGEWVKHHDEALRIVPQPLWDRVQARLSNRREHKTGRKETYLFSGMLRCGVCGGAYVKVDRYRYGCATHKDRGLEVCGNGMKVAVAVANRELLSALREGIASEEAMDLFKREASAALRADKRAAGEDATRSRMAALERQIANLVKAIADGANSSALRDALASAEEEQATLRAELAVRGRVAAIPDLLPQAALRYRTILQNLDTTLGDDVDGSRAILRELLGESIKLVPVPEAQAMEACIPGTGVYRLATRLAGALSDNVVAGAGFGQYLTPHILRLPASGKVSGSKPHLGKPTAIPAARVVHVCK